MGRHEQLPPWAVTSDFAPNLPRASRRRRKSANLDGDVLLSVWTETRRQPRGVRPQPWGGASGDQGTRGSVLSCQSGGALASEPAPEAPRIPSSSSVAFFLKLFSSCCTCPASYSAISCIRLTADHSSHRSPRLHLAPDALLIACTQQRAAVPVTSPSPSEPNGRARWPGSEDPLRQRRASLRRSTT